MKLLTMPIKKLMTLMVKKTRNALKKIDQFNKNVKSNRHNTIKY